MVIYIFLNLFYSYWVNATTIYISDNIPNTNSVINDDGNIINKFINIKLFEKYILIVYTYVLMD